MTDLPELATPKEVANYLRTTEHKVKNLCIRGDMRFIKVGRDKLIKREFVKEFLKENEQCQNNQKDRRLHTEKKEIAGKCSNTEQGNGSGYNQVLTALNLLDSGLPGIQSKTGVEKGQVIHMNGRSQTC